MCLLDRLEWVCEDMAQWFSRSWGGVSVCVTVRGLRVSWYRVVLRVGGSCGRCCAAGCQFVFGCGCGRLSDVVVGVQGWWLGIGRSLAQSVERNRRQALQPRLPTLSSTFCPPSQHHRRSRHTHYNCCRDQRNVITFRSPLVRVHRTVTGTSARTARRIVLTPWPTLLVLPHPVGNPRIVHPDQQCTALCSSAAVAGSRTAVLCVLFVAFSVFACF